MCIAHLFRVEGVPPSNRGQDARDTMVGRASLTVKRFLQLDSCFRRNDTYRASGIENPVCPIHQPPDISNCVILYPVF